MHMMHFQIRVHRESIYIPVFGSRRVCPSSFLPPFSPPVSPTAAQYCPTCFIVSSLTTWKLIFKPEKVTLYPSIDILIHQENKSVETNNVTVLLCSALPALAAARRTELSCPSAIVNPVSSRVDCKTPLKYGLQFSLFAVWLEEVS